LTDEVATGVEGVGAYAEQFSYLRADVLRAHRGVHHASSLN
jgi:hypothetical protein